MGNCHVMTYIPTQLRLTCSKSKHQNNMWNMLKVNNNDMRTKLLLTKDYFQQVNSGWVLTPRFTNNEYT